MIRNINVKIAHMQVSIIRNIPEGKFERRSAPEIPRFNDLEILFDVPEWVFEEIEILMGKGSDC